MLICFGEGMAQSSMMSPSEVFVLILLPGFKTVLHMQLGPASSIKYRVGPRLLVSAFCIRRLQKVNRIQKMSTENS